MTRSLITLALLATIVGTWVRPAEAQEAPRRGFVWDGRPSIVLGEDIHVDLRARAVFDWRGFDPNLDEDLYDLNVLRVGLKGDVTRHFDFEIERELEYDGSWEDWKDVYLNWDTFDAFSVRGGRFKMPFGFEQNLSRTDLDFIFRTRISTQLTPARDKGVMVYGRFFGRGLTYEAGWFDSDGDLGKLTEPQFPGTGSPRLGPTWSGRVTGTPLRPLAGARAWRSLRVGVAYTNGRVPEGLNSLRGETPFGYDYFEPVYVKGRRQRLGFELDWTPRSFGVRSEWIRSREDRIAQGLGDRDLSDVLGSGWYVAGTWIVTGQDKDDSISMRRALIRGGPGAIELAVRYEELGFGSAAKDGPPLRGPRADHILENRDRIWSVGVNWYAMDHVKIVGNAIHEAFEDAERTPLAGHTAFWSGVLRLQVVF